MGFARVATLASALLIAACDFGIDTKGLVGDGAAPDVAPTDGSTDAPPPSDGGTEAATEAGPTTLVGDGNVESTSVAVAPGDPHAFRFQAAASGTAQTVWVYVDSKTSGASFAVGLYDDDATQTTPQPKSLLAQATFSSPATGTWVSQPLPSTAIQSGSFYWLAIDATSGTLYYRIVGGTSGSLESVSASSSTLPTTWSTTSTAMDGPASIYVTN